VNPPSGARGVALRADRGAGGARQLDASGRDVQAAREYFRCVNIALVNELKMLGARMGFDIWEVIDAAATKPFGFMPFYPDWTGRALHPVDPYYLSWKAREYDFATRFIELAGEVNTAMPFTSSMRWRRRSRPAES